MIAELILWAEGKPTVTLFEYKAVRQTGRDPTWNVLGVLSEKFFFLIKHLLTAIVSLMYMSQKMYSPILKSY